MQIRICEKIEEWIKEHVKKPIERWIERQERRCDKLPWPLSWVCKFVVVVLKIVDFVIDIVDRLIVRQVCRYVQLVFRVAFTYVAFFLNIVKDLFLRPSQTLKNMWDFVKSPFTGHCPGYRLADPDRLLMIAHRGAAKTFAENTVQALRFAIETEGANALELDICMTQDGKIIAWHDWEPNDEISLLRQLGRHPDSLYKPVVPSVGSEWRRQVIYLTLSEFREHYGYEKMDRDYRQPSGLPPADLTIPILDDVMVQLVGHANLRAVFLDIKMPNDSAGRAAEMLERIHESIPRDGSFEVVLLVPARRVLDRMKEHSREKNYRLPFSYDREFPPGIVINVEDYSAIDSAFALKNDVASVGRPTSATLLPWKTYTRLLEYDLPKWATMRNTTGGWGAEGLVRWYVAWTFNEADELECLCEAGVSGILTDDIPRLKQIAQAKGRV